MAEKNEHTVERMMPVARTSAGLRDAIFDEIDSIRNGTSNPTRANAVAKLATGIVETVRMELEVHKALHRGEPAAETHKSGSLLLPQPLALGAGSPPAEQAAA